MNAISYISVQACTMCDAMRSVCESSAAECVRHESSAEESSGPASRYGTVRVCVCDVCDGKLENS